MSDEQSRPQTTETPVFEQDERVTDPTADNAVQIPDHPELSGRKVHPLTLPSPNQAYLDDPETFGAEEAPPVQKDHEDNPVHSGVGDSN